MELTADERYILSNWTIAILSTKAKALAKEYDSARDFVKSYPDRANAKYISEVSKKMADAFGDLFAGLFLYGTAEEREVVLKVVKGAINDG